MGVFTKSIPVLLLALLCFSSPPAAAQSKAPIKIGIITEESAIAGGSISKAAQMAADAINQSGGVDGRKIELVLYDDHSSAADAVRAFQRAVSEDKVTAVVGSYISEVALALQPWAGRLKTPFITTGATANDISKNVHDNYEVNKYTFHEWLTSAFLADIICDGVKALMVDKYGAKSGVVLVEDAAWTTPLEAELVVCLPKAGIKVLDHIRFAEATSDFSPLFNKIEAMKPDVIVTGLSHVGVQPTIQWAQQQVPIPMIGMAMQASSGKFWSDTNGATAGVITLAPAVVGVDLTPTTQSFIADYTAKFGAPPPYPAYNTYDAINILAQAIHRAGSDNGDKLVDALEKTDYVGTIGRVQFYGRSDASTHAVRYGADYINGVMLQWQDGKQVAMWPKTASGAQLSFPAFIHMPAAH